MILPITPFLARAGGWLGARKYVPWTSRPAQPVALPVVDLFVPPPLPAPKKDAVIVAPMKDFDAQLHRETPLPPGNYIVVLDKVKTTEVMEDGSTVGVQLNFKTLDGRLFKQHIRW